MNTAKRPMVGINTLAAAMVLTPNARAPDDNAVQLVSDYVQREIESVARSCPFGAYTVEDLEERRPYTLTRRYIPDRDMDEYTVVDRLKAEVLLVTEEPMRIGDMLNAMLMLTGPRPLSGDEQWKQAVRRAFGGRVLRGGGK